MRIARLGLEDMDAAARIHRTAFDDRLPWLSGLHTPDEDRAWFRGHVFETCQVWGAWNDLALAGMMAFREGWIDQLYVLPDAQGQGLGSALLDLAKSAFADLRLWTFQRNAGARRFYDFHGFQAVEFTDGQRNDEKEPDVLYRWARG
jgi:GNAT superfamily N-acetyltransferase